jgi:hypothetical protein
MTTLREAAQQALETLEALSAAENIIWVQKRAEIEVEHLRAALAQPEQAEPVAWIPSQNLEEARRAPFVCRVSLARQRHRTDFVALYTQPPRREWQGLTNEEMYGLYRRAGLEAYYPRDGVVQGDYDRRIDAYARAIETKLKEKNNG